jgi:DNA-binding NtrC family response regulator
MVPSVLESTVGLLERGRFRQALSDIKRVYDRADPRHRAVMGEILWRLGDVAEAKDVLSSLVKSESLAVKPRVFEVLGFIARAEGQLARASDYVRRSFELAEQAGSAYQSCRAQLALFSITLDLAGALACESIAIRLRRDVLRTGDPFLVSYLHCRFAEYEARRGAIDRAFRHIEIGLGGTDRHQNLWLEGNLWLVRSASEWLSGQLPESLASANKAHELSKVSGHRHTEMSSLGNLGYVSLFVGDVARSRKALDEGERLSKVSSHLMMSLQESRAQLELISGNFAECRAVLAALEARSAEGGSDRESWPSVEGKLTKARWLRASGAAGAALALLESTQKIVGGRGDRPLEMEVEIERADLLSTIGRIDEAWRVFEKVSRFTETTNLAGLADVQWLRARLLAASGDSRHAIAELARARRVWSELGGHSPHRALEESGLGTDVQGSPSLEDQHAERAARQAVTGLLQLGARPVLLANEAATMLSPGDEVRAVKLTATTEGETSICWERPQNVRFAKPLVEFTVSLGKWKGAEYSLSVDPFDSLESRESARVVLRLVKAAVDLERLRQEEQYRTSLWPVDEDLMLGGHIYIAPRVRELVAAARRIAPTDLPVLITGETGTGKEILAREVHDSSRRAKKPFAVFVCSAVPRETLDSHLFGHRRGAFTGAVDNFPGVIRAHDGGTLFLDEIAEIGPDLQTKLLRFLESGEIHPLGETRPVSVNVRVIAATNQPLEQLLADGRFREDFYYRLNVMRFHLPPLRERREEILPLIDHFLTRECAQIGRPVPALSDAAVEHLLLHRWPGNIRQLYNEVRRIAATLEPNVPITPDVLAPEIVAERRAAIASATTTAPNQLVIRLDQTLQTGVEQLERAMIQHALETSDGHLETAARRLGISRKGLFLKRQRLEIA